MTAPRIPCSLRRSGAAPSTAKITPDRGWAIAAQARRLGLLAEPEREKGKSAIQRAAEHDQDDRHDQRENLQQPRVRGRLVGVEAARSPPSSHDVRPRCSPIDPRHGPGDYTPRVRFPAKKTVRAGLGAAPERRKLQGIRGAVI